MKKAFLVGFTPLTRVVMDVPTDFEPVHHPGIAKEIIAKAREQIIENAPDKLNLENCDRLEEDTECPYDEKRDKANEDIIREVVREFGKDGILEDDGDTLSDIQWSFLYTVLGNTDGDDFALKSIKASELDIKFFWQACSSDAELTYSLDEMERDCLQYIAEQLKDSFTI